MLYIVCEIIMAITTVNINANNVKVNISEAQRCAWVVALECHLHYVRMDDNCGRLEGWPRSDLFWGEVSLEW